MLNIQLRLLMYLYKCRGEKNTFTLLGSVMGQGGGVQGSQKRSENSKRVLDPWASILF